MKLKNVAEFEDLKSRLAERLGTKSALDSVGDWICRHTRISDAPYSFRNHEYQEHIANDLSPTLVAQKPTQIGFSELSVRIMLALCGIRRNFKVIYILPSAKFAGEFAKTRIDTVIETSERLSNMIVRGSDGAMMKRIGSSIMYMGGAATKNQAISRPADCLIMDEVDFANQEVLTSYEGRLAHCENPMRRRFSTPTISGYGINKDLSISDQMRYLVKCSCGHENAPDFNKDLFIPGFSENYGEFKLFTKEHLTSEEINVSEAHLRCQKCHGPLTKALLDPSKRRWVATHTGTQRIRGYEIKPFDLPRYNSIPDLIYRFANYADEEDYWNFCQGEVCDSDENQVSKEIMSNQFTLDATTLPSNLCMGVDVGRANCHVFIGTQGKVFRRFTLNISDGEFHVQLSNLFKEYKCIQGIIDIGPEASIGRTLRAEFGDQWLMCSYRKDIHNDPWYYSVQEDKGVVSMQRTKGFNLLVKAMNRKQWTLAPGPDKATVLNHFVGMKRVKKDDEEGGREALWEKVGDDHYLHSLMYLQVALDVADKAHDGVHSKISVPVLPGLGGVSLGSTWGTSYGSLRDLMVSRGIR